MKFDEETDVEQAHQKNYQERPTRRVRRVDYGVISSGTIRNISDDEGENADIGTDTN